MPATIRLTLDLSARPQVYPARLHGAACTLLESPDSEHHRQRKPFAVQPLHDVDGGTRWQLGWLEGSAPPDMPAAVDLGGARCPVVEHHTETTGFAQLANSKPARHAQLEVISPLYFSRNGRDHPLPDPVLILRSTIQRWNSHAPEALAIGEDAGRALTKQVFLHDFAGETVRTPVSATMHQTGFLGTVRIGLGKSADRSGRVVFAALLRFAALAGIGAQTTHGFGAVQLQELDA